MSNGRRPGAAKPFEGVRLHVVSGKGGTGKTTISSLVVRHFVRAGKTPVFAVDADANYNLNDQLGVEVKSTIGASREEMKRKISANEAPAGISKDDWIEMQMAADLIESEGVTFVGGVPTIIAGLYQYLKQEGRTLPPLRQIIVGGSALPRVLLEGFEQMGVEVVHAWGMTELSADDVKAIQAAMAAKKR